jgi:hypothetical protein
MDHNHPKDPFDARDPEDDDARNRGEPRRHPQDPAPLAPNGEGSLAAPDASWRPDPLNTGAADRIAKEMARIQLAEAQSGSLFVADVAHGLRTLPIERFESILVAIGEAARLHERLPQLRRGTLATEFIRWCRNKNPGILAHDLAALLAVRGITLAAEYRAALEKEFENHPGH